MFLFVCLFGEKSLTECLISRINPALIDCMFLFVCLLRKASVLHHLFFEMRGEKKPNKVIALNWCCFCPDMTYPQGGRFDRNQYLRTGADFVCLLLYSLVYLLLCGAHRQVSKPVFLFFYWQIPETISKPRNASTCVDYSKSST